MNLRNLKSPNEIASLTPNRGDWVLGYGWDQYCWNPSRLPEATDLPFTLNPIAFTRVDGHALWVNSAATERAGGVEAFAQFSEEMCPRNPDGSLKGLLIDSAMTPVLQQIPAPDTTDILDSLTLGVRYFNERGFTHIRDLTCTKAQWQASSVLEDRGQLTLAVEQYFDCLPYRTFEPALAEALYARKHKSRLRRVTGIKVFFDGALGSEGALMSCCYPSGQFGLQLLTLDELTEVAIKTWESGLRLAVHMIGDEAAHRAVSHFCELRKSSKHLASLKLDQSSGRELPLDFEHCEIMRAETIANLPALGPTVHMQPCHWLSDRRWLKTKFAEVPGQLFPWSEIESKARALYFGSDAPIEAASVLLNEEALRDAETVGIKRPQYPAHHYQSHCDEVWVPNCWTELEGETIKTFFEGRQVN